MSWLGSDGSIRSDDVVCLGTVLRHDMLHVVTTLLVVVEIAVVTLLAFCNVEESAASLFTHLRRCCRVIPRTLVWNFTEVLQPVEAEGAVTLFDEFQLHHLGCSILLLLLLVGLICGQERIGGSLVHRCGSAWNLYM